MPAASASAAGAEEAAPLVARLEAAEDAGAVDARQLADLLGVTAGALRAALARPHALSGEQAAAVARARSVLSSAPPGRSTCCSTARASSTRTRR